MRLFRRGVMALGLVAGVSLGAVAARAEHSTVDFPGIGQVTLRTIKALGALPSVALAGPDGTLNPTVHYAVLPGPNVSSRAVLAVAAAMGGSDCAYEAIVFGSDRGKLSLWTPDTIDTMAEGGIYVGDLGGRRGYGMAVWNFIWGNEAHVAPHRYRVLLYKLNNKMQFFRTGTLTTRGHYANDMAALKELKLDFPNLTTTIPNLAC